MRIFLFLLLLSANAHAFPAKFGVSPDNSQELILQTVQSAERSLVINIYMWTSIRLQRAVAEKIEQGVEVSVLVETEPFGGKIVPPQKQVLDNLAEAMRKKGNPRNRLLMMSSRGGSVERRYTFNHAKYVIVDGRSAYISTENFVNSGVMADPKRKGNRGWQVLLESPAAAQRLMQYFREDTDAKNADVSEYDPRFVTVLEDRPRDQGHGGGQERDNSRSLPPIALGSGNATKTEFCASPRSETCLESFIGAAKESLDIQHLSLPLYWPKERGEGRRLNPILDAAIKAAKRGVTVRILLNAGLEEDSNNAPRSPNAPPPYNARETADYLRRVAQEQNLPLQAALMNNEALQLVTTHNKSMLADGKRAFVGSINGTWNSVTNNREIGVALDSRDAAAYFGEVFQGDWMRSVR